MSNADILERELRAKNNVLDLSNIKLNKKKKSNIKKIFNNDITFLLIAVFSGIGAIMMGAYISIEFITTICGGK